MSFLYMHYAHERCTFLNDSMVKVGKVLKMFFSTESMADALRPS